jgi:glycosyltransferase involved in cell wall biosynthesis
LDSAGWEEKKRQRDHPGRSLFLVGAGLYKARGRYSHAHNHLPGRNDRTAATLIHDGIERNLSMAVGISVVVPVKDEVENVAPLAREIAAAIAGETSAEIIFIDDGSSDGTVDALKALRKEIPSLRVIQHARNLGQSRGILTGVRAARSEIIVTLDGDGQNDPADIPKLLAVLRNDPDAENIGVVSGVRAKRRDTLSRRLASRIGNGIRARLLHDGATDTGCGLKALRRDAFLALPYFDHIHRFIITLMMREGYGVRFVEVNHRERAHGASKYTNFNRMLVSVNDLLGVRWLQRRYRGKTEAKEI